LNISPSGFVLKSQKKALSGAAKATKISLEWFLEVEVRPLSHICSIDLSLYALLICLSFLGCPAMRRKPGSNLTIVTPNIYRVNKCAIEQEDSGIRCAAEE
jgi:hypothetical protein